MSRVHFPTSGFTAAFRLSTGARGWLRGSSGSMTLTSLVSHQRLTHGGADLVNFEEQKRFDKVVVRALAVSG